MNRIIEEPVTKAETGWGDDERTVTTHPAFAQIAASRVSGSASLYASDFRHNHFMTITIRRSELHRNLSSDWHFGGAELIEVALSESQWATFVSAPNVGMGVPCTIQHINQEQTPGLPDPHAKSDQFREEVRRRIEKSLAEIDSIVAEVESLDLPKGKAAKIKARAETARRELGANLPWVAKVFEEHMEETTERAKAEIHGYMTGTLMRAGLDKLTGGAMPLQIEGRD